MKKADIATIILVASLSTLITYWVVDAMLPKPDEMTETIETMDIISVEVAEPDGEVFNPSAINPTVEVFVGRCEDVDQNGYIDEAEQAACDQGGEEPEEDE